MIEKLSLDSGIIVNDIRLKSSVLFSSVSAHIDFAIVELRLKFSLDHDSKYKSFYCLFSSYFLSIFNGLRTV